MSTMTSVVIHVPWDYEVPEEETVYSGTAEIEGTSLDDYGPVWIRHDTGHMVPRDSNLWKLIAFHLMTSQPVYDSMSEALWEASHED